MKQFSIFSFLLTLCVFSACSKDNSSSSNTFVREEEPHNSLISYGYDRYGELSGNTQAFEDCRSDIYRFYDDLSPQNDYKKAYVYMGLAGKTGAYLYYGYNVYFPVKKTYSFQIKEHNTCLYQENWTVPAEGVWSWSCNYSNTTKYSSHVGESGRQTLPSGDKTIWQKSYSVIPAENAGLDTPTFVLYSDDTYIDVFVSGKQAHFIQRLPGYADLGVFYSK